jgi:hypothetical protein
MERSWKAAAASRSDFYSNLEGIYGFGAAYPLPQVTRREAQLRPWEQGVASSNLAVPIEKALETGPFLLAPCPY